MYHIYNKRKINTSIDAYNTIYIFGMDISLTDVLANVYFLIHGILCLPFVYDKRMYIQCVFKKPLQYKYIQS